MPARALPPRQQDPVAELAALVVAMTPAELEAFAAQLPPEDLALLEHVVAERHAAGWRATPATLAANLDPTVQAWPYVRLLADNFVAAVDGTRPRQIWNLPSRMGKTTLLRWGVVWGLDRRPESRWIYVTYGKDLALESATAIRDLLREHAGRLTTQLRRDRQRADRFVTEAGGGVLGAGMNTAIIGFGAGDGGALIVDDPMKNWQDAHSAAARQRTWDAFRGTLRHRLDSEATGIIVVHARWHQDDLTGRLLQQEAEDGTGEDWHLVNLPALATDPADPLGRQPGEVIEPERFALPAVLARHRALGTYLTAALEQQDPTPPEGKELRRDWFVLTAPGDRPPRPEVAVAAWDFKLKNREAGDYVVGQVWWRQAGGYWLMDQLRGQYDHATTGNAVALLLVRNPLVRQTYIEAAGSADEVVPELRKAHADYTVSDAMALRLGMTPDEREAVQALRRRGLANLTTVPAKGDKSVRARTYIAPAAEAGLVRLPAEAPWLAEYLDEVTAFPDGAYDDQVDATSLALSRLGSGQASARAPAGTVPKPTPGAQRAAAPAPQQRAAASIVRPAGRLPRR